MIRIKILNWEKHQERRSDKYKNSWFKFQHDFLSSSEAHQLTESGRLFWVILLSEASKFNSSCIEVDEKYLRSKYNVFQSKIKVHIRKFKEFGWIEEFRDTIVTRSSHVDQEKSREEESYNPLKSANTGDQERSHAARAINLPVDESEQLVLESGNSKDCHSSDSERESSSGRDQPTSLSSDSSEASSCKQPPQSTPPIGRRPPAAVITPDDLFNLWNELVKGVFPVVEKRTEERSKKARAVIKAMTADIKDREQALDVFRQIIKYYLGNKFYTGTNERGWVMDISHLLKPQKAIEAWERLNATKRQRPKITIHDSSHWGGLSQGETNLPESTDGISNSSMEDF